MPSLSMGGGQPGVDGDGEGGGGVDAEDAGLAGGLVPLAAVGGREVDQRRPGLILAQGRPQIPLYPQLKAFMVEIRLLSLNAPNKQAQVKERDVGGCVVQGLEEGGRSGGDSLWIGRGRSHETCHIYSQQGIQASVRENGWGHRCLAA